MELNVIEFVNIDHIAQAVRDADKQVQFLSDVLGLRAVSYTHLTLPTILRV